MREMTAPGVWSDMGPQPAIARPGGYRTLGGSIVSARKAPMLGIQTTAERARMLRKNARASGQRADYQVAVRCAVILPVMHVPCHRTAGHRGCHLAAETMERSAERRRKWAR